MKRLCFSHLAAQQEVNQSLVDDGLVDMDKIGASNFFWSFPSKVAVTKQNVVDTLKQKITKVVTGGLLSFLAGFFKPNSGSFFPTVVRKAQSASPHVCNRQQRPCPLPLSCFGLALALAGRHRHIIYSCVVQRDGATRSCSVLLGT